MLAIDTRRLSPLAVEWIRSYRTDVRFGRSFRGAESGQFGAIRVRECDKERVIISAWECDGSGRDGFDVVIRRRSCSRVAKEIIRKIIT